MLIELIRKWLKKRLGIHLSIIPKYFYNAARDGTLVAQLLLHYGVITPEEANLIEETQDSVQAFDNYQHHIAKWLSRVKLQLTESEMYEIAYCEGTVAATIFYELYLKLEAKQDSIPIKPKNHHFKIEKVSEFQMNDFFIEANPLCEPLIKQWDIINWEKDHLASLMMKYMNSREEYKDYLEEKKIKELSASVNVDKLEDTLVFLKAEKTDYTYDQLIAQQKAALEMEPFEPNQDEARRIISQIKKRKKQRAERTAFRLQLQHQLLSDVWKKIEESQEFDFDKVICEKLLKQSLHEKEIEEKLLIIRKQKDTIVANRKVHDEIDQKKRDEEFIRRLFEEDLEERMKFHQERMAQIAEHKRLYEGKIKLKALKHQKLCQEVMDDIIDIALKTEEYKDTYNVEPDKYVKRQWANLFIKQQPIFDLVVPSQDLKQPHEDISAELEAIYRQEIQRQDILDEQDFEDYINFSNIWQIEEGLDEFLTPMELGMNCVGFAVHKLLLKKYPLPIPEKAQVSQEIEISVCATLSDLSRIDMLQRLLNLKNIKVMLIEDAVNFCIEGYESELKTEFDEPFPEEEYLRELTPKIGKKQEKKNKGKKGKKGDKASKKSKDKKKDKKGKKGKKGVEKTHVEVTFEEKQAQTPRLFPWEKVVFSNRAKLGRLVKQILGQGDPLDDKLQVDMFIEYLSSLKDIKGWVLLNFPYTYEQAALLEEALSGKAVPKQYFDKFLNKESLTSVEIEETEGIEEEEIPSSVTPEELPPREDFIFKNIQENKVTLAENITQSQPSFFSETTECISDVTMQTEFNYNPEERVKKLLPDLINLAYSSEEENEVETQPDPKKCICVCNQETEEVNSAEETVEVVSDMNEIASEMKKSVEYDQIEEQKIEENQECVCYVDKIKDDEIPVEVQEATIQTDILGLMHELGASDSKPIERIVVEDIYEDKRLSKVVPNPRPLEKEEYNTVLTAFIKVCQKKEENDEDEDFPLPYFKEIERKDGLEKFYCDQGCYYILQYDEFNAETVKCLAKMIIGDYNLPLKNSIEIFGEHYKEALLDVGDHQIVKKGKKEKKDKKKKGKKEKKPKPSKSKSGTKAGKKDKKGKKSEKSSKSSKKSKKDKKGKKGKKAKSTHDLLEEVGHEDKEVQFPAVEEIEEEELPEPRAGEPDWEYINLAIPPEIELILANHWDNFEESYIKNFKDLFFNKRVLLNEIVPFLAQTKETMNEFIVRPDQKQYYLREFQKTLNAIGLDLRNDQATKTELLCMIEEFRDKLLGICDTKMQESEEERRRFVRQNWLFHQFCQITNNCAEAFQFEIDRTVDTLQFLSDYYISVITKSSKEGYEFHKQILPKFDCDDLQSDDFNSLFIDVESENCDKSAFHEYITNSNQTALGFVDSMKPLALKPVQDMKKLFEPEEKVKEKKKKQKTKQKKIELEEDVKENQDRIFEEWQCAIDGEFARTYVHLSVIRNEAFNRFNDAISWIKKIFEEIYDTISEKYENELSNVNKACELLAYSVEQEMIIQPELAFEGEHLAQIQVTLFPATLEMFEEDYSEGCFKIEQLEFMVKVLLDLAHSGYIMRHCFLLLIQDILYYDFEESEEVATPKLWRNLSTSALNILLRRLFDDESYLYWRDFIICNLMVSFPTREELMKVRQQCRQYDPDLTEKINRDEFETVEFWFEDNRVKNLLFSMYQLDENEINYTALLLDFCKDHDPIIGFVKALELSLGQFICCDKALGEKFVEEILEDRILFEKKKKEHEENIILAKNAVSLLIDRIVDQFEDPEGLTLREIEEHRDSIEEKSRSKSFQSDFVGQIITEHKFSFTNIGFEARDNTGMAFFLPRGLVQIIVNTDITWNSKIELPDSESFSDKIMNIYDNCRNEKFNNVVLAHEFLNCEELRELFQNTNKFSAHNPVKHIITEPEIDEPEEFVLRQGSKHSQNTETINTHNSY
ncbi:sperm flagellar protein 2-like [Tribolium madens]|uniref:sperm flagellar protein 2-like n=1 Tax=Tribolium madens TaxID=41895 RepID=UPI001CF76261|nr:sperm flagellar protein 2-like [Tribolium madens]